ncbi:hypothetical protein [Nonomuraea sp. NPDC050643]
MVVTWPHWQTRPATAEMDGMSSDDLPVLEKHMKRSRTAASAAT